MTNIIKLFLVFFVSILFSLGALASGTNLLQKVVGDVYVNKSKASEGATVKSGDEITTVSKSNATVLFGDEVYQLRENTTFVLPKSIEKKDTSSLIAGSVLAAFTPGKPRQMKIGRASCRERG